MDKYKFWRTCEPLNMPDVKMRVLQQMLKEYCAVPKEQGSSRFQDALFVAAEHRLMTAFKAYAPEFVADNEELTMMYADNLANMMLAFITDRSPYWNFNK